ncbi:4-(cytidine 5'-diphospho)-2-C-methyl-D-erythritol kinase [Thermovenabulum gondwanense]|uniref:4-diphosphocytidyl-2-C-methyl-D-erythritol kinase n=1 Tax=Thermovenabulum gondwanense TaxID=520767 RepID=A0A162MTA5_9FIRM|nr:4-(cytidine 5'-diphospho)-2-C-methyl-D-erythritol kinase [Thermovenabulum gondwanense]KYO67283.1 4-diphosphocytidyl-2-C-methyl-D-erythritol kinase [Thermovenabulum gondwanense]
MHRFEMDVKAKINLTLDVLYKRQDGYHEVEMIMQTISLSDRVSIRLLPEKEIRILCEAPGVPLNEENTAYKAAKLMMDKFNLDAGLEIDIKKYIPVAAGLAGGSADAAAVLMGINEIFDLKKDLGQLMELGKIIGADVPFSIMGGTAVARGIGEKLEPLPGLKDIVVLLVKPPYFVSTKEVYSRLNVGNIKKRPDTMGTIDKIKRADVRGIAEGLCNVLEEVTFKMHPELERIKEAMKERGALGSLMSGSGPTVYGIFESLKDAQKAAEKFNGNNNTVIITELS